MNDIVITNQHIHELGNETAKILKECQDELQKIKWSDGEANIDTEYSILACKCCCKAWIIIKHKYKEYSEIIITCIHPDINIIFSYLNGTKCSKKIELKSSKKKKIPGSTIKNLNINQPLIFCLRPSNSTDKYQIRYSQYHNAMGESEIDLFQDRTPRPSINFQKMKDLPNVLPFEFKEKSHWITHYANCAINRIDENVQCKLSWQDELLKIIKKKIIEDYLLNTSIEQIEEDQISLQFKNINI